VLDQGRERRTENKRKREREKEREREREKDWLRTAWTTAKLVPTICEELRGCKVVRDEFVYM